MTDGPLTGLVDAAHETVELPVEPVHHTLHLSHRHLSRERSFDAVEGQIISFWCRGALMWPMYLAALTKPDLSITLKPGVGYRAGGAAARLGP